MKSTIKKLLLTGVALLLFILTACGSPTAVEEKIDITSEDSNGESTEDMESESEPTDSAEPSLEEDDVPLSAEEAFRAVLLNEMPFFYTSRTSGIFEYYEYLNAVPLFNYMPMATPYFAIVDMDGDTVPEVVLEIDDYSGFIILRYKDGVIYGNELGYRSLQSLKEDGSFHASSSAFEYEDDKMFFIDSAILFYPMMEVCYDAYYSYDMPIEQKTWEELQAIYKEIPSVEWYEFSEEAIEGWLVDNPVFADIPEENMEMIIERQNYLDSLSYLVDMTYESYDMYTGRGLEQYRNTAEDYYDGCHEEMDKIYRLCEEKLSADELEKLETEQQLWEEYMEQSMEEDMNADSSVTDPKAKEAFIYFRYGDMALRRIFRLINLYYDNHFYD